MTGTTTRQMREAPRGATYLWCTNDLTYPTRLQRSIGRADLAVTPASRLGEFVDWTPENIVIDHAVHITPDRARQIAALMRRGVRVHHTAGRAEIAYAAFEAARDGWIDAKPQPTLRSTMQTVVDAIKARLKPRPARPPQPPRPRDVIAYELFVERARFDGTYIFTDDRETFLRGEQHFKRICALQDELDRSEA